MIDLPILSIRRCEYFNGTSNFIFIIIVGYMMNKMGQSETIFALLLLGFAFTMLGALGLFVACSFSKLEFYDDKIIAYIFFSKIERKYTQIQYFYAPYKYPFKPRVLMMKFSDYSLPIPFYGLERYLVRNESFDTALETLRTKGVKERWALFF